MHNKLDNFFLSVTFLLVKCGPSLKWIFGYLNIEYEIMVWYWLFAQDKAGKVILPAKDDEPDDDMALSEAYLQKYTLQSLEDKICIIVSICTVNSCGILPALVFFTCLWQLPFRL